MTVKDVDIIAIVSDEIDHQLANNLILVEKHANALADCFVSFASDGSQWLDSTIARADRQLAESIWAQARVATDKKSQIEAVRKNLRQCRVDLAELPLPPSRLRGVIVSGIVIVLTSFILAVIGVLGMLLYLHFTVAKTTPLVALVLLAVVSCGILVMVLFGIRTNPKEERVQRKAFTEATKAVRKAENDLALRTAECEAIMGPLRAEVLKLMKREVARRLEEVREKFCGPEN